MLMQNALVGVFLVLFVLLSTRYKLQYAEAIRPFYSYGLVVSVMLIVSCLLRSSDARKILTTMLIQPQTLLFAFLLVYFTASVTYISLDIPGRQLKDHLYFLYWILILPLLPICFVSKNKSISDVFLLLSKSVILFSVFFNEPK